MPNREEHTVLGAFAGGSVSLISALMHDPDDLAGAMVELLGGVVFGSVFANAPDAIEPSTRGPNHRALAHSATAGAVVVASGAKLAPELVSSLRMRSAALRAHSRNWALWHRFLAGGVVGSHVGFVSHLLADARTDKGLPLLGKVQ